MGAGMGTGQQDHTHSQVNMEWKHYVNMRVLEIPSLWAPPLFSEVPTSLELSNILIRIWSSY